jgi:pimeloyl-ACP methyl ester carboxylesterase
MLDDDRNNLSPTDRFIDYPSLYPCDSDPNSQQGDHASTFRDDQSTNALSDQLHSALQFDTQPSIHQQVSFTPPAGGGDYATPDQSFFATQLFQNTAYRLIEPEEELDANGAPLKPITIVCLHGLTDSSYIWEDIVELLSLTDLGPRARVVVLDFYGRGR